MAVVKRATVKILGVEFRKIQNYDAKSDQFWMLLPTIVQQELNLNYMRITGISCADLDKQLDVLVQQVKDKKTLTTKVIVIDVRLKATLWGNKPELDGERGIVQQYDEVPFAHGLAVSLAAGVYNETKTSLDSGFTVKYAYQASTIPESFRHDNGCEAAAIVPWTQYLEDEIAHYCLNLESMVLEAKELQGLVESKKHG